MFCQVVKTVPIQHLMYLRLKKTLEELEYTASVVSLNQFSRQLIVGTYLLILPVLFLWMDFPFIIIADDDDYVGIAENDLTIQLYIDITNQISVELIDFLLIALNNQRDLGISLSPFQFLLNAISGSHELHPTSNAFERDSYCFFLLQYVIGIRAQLLCSFTCWYFKLPFSKVLKFH